MASPAEQRRRIRDLILELEPSVAEAFDQAIRDIRSNIILRQVVAALEQGNIAAAVLALNIDEAAFAALADAVIAAYNSGGQLTTLLLPRLNDRQGNRVVVRWNVRNPRAEAEIRNHAAQLITHVTEETREAARETILRGYTAGRGPKQIGLDLAGPVDEITGRREGGIIGLSRPQAEASNNMRARLLSGDPAEMRKVLAMKLRDKGLRGSYDKAIQAAIDAGKPVPAAQVEKMVQRYNDRAIKHRGDMIALTETGESVMAARQEATRQAAQKAGYTDTAIVKKWKHSHKRDRREDHFAMNNKTVRGLDTPFQFPGGVRMRFPMDRSLGARAKDIIGCACDYEINFDFSQGVT